MKSSAILARSPPNPDTFETAMTDRSPEIQLQDLATKHDLKELELKIGAQLLLLKWMTGVMLAGVISLII